MRGSTIVPPKDNPLTEELLFLRGLIANPRRVGAIAPSTPALGRVMAAQLDPDRPGPILELGPGTGTVTRQILARGIAPERVTVVEHDPEFAKLMEERFPRVTVVQGDAFDLNRTLNGAGGEAFSGIISGLPLLNHPLARRRALIEGCFARLKPYAPFIQFSYGFYKPVPPPPGVAVSLAAFVWLNFPPTHVWVYRQKTEDRKQGSERPRPF